MDVSVIVSTYNRAASLRETLETLDAQITAPSLHWELLVVDTNSSDGTREVIENFARTARIPVRQLFLQRHGLSHGRNEGIACSQGAIVAFTDDDVSLPTEWVRNIAAVMGEVETDILGGRILPDWQYPPPRWLAMRTGLHDALTIMDHDQFAWVVKADQRPTVWGANMAFRRTVFDKVGLFDTRRGLCGTRLYRGEELDLVSRALSAGCRAVYHPRVVVWHRIRAPRMRIAYFSRLYFQRSEGEAVAQGPPGFHELFSAHVRTGDRISRLAQAIVRRGADRLDRWLDCCDAAGRLWGLWRATFAS